MALFQLILFVLLALKVSTMFSGFMLARRMGFYLMMQMYALMLGMFLGIGVLISGVFFPGVQIFGVDLTYILLIANFVLMLLATLMQFVQVVPILLKTMQGGPFHSSHNTNLLVTLFLLLGLVIYYAELVAMP